MVAIEVDKWCCGNCGLNWGGTCGFSYRQITDSKPACNLIHENFIDRGYKVKFQKIDFFPPKDTSLRSKDAKS